VSLAFDHGVRRYIFSRSLLARIENKICFDYFTPNPKEIQWAPWSSHDLMEELTDRRMNHLMKTQMTWSLNLGDVATAGACHDIRTPFYIDHNILRNCQPYHDVIYSCIAIFHAPALTHVKINLPNLKKIPLSFFFSCFLFFS